MCDERRVVMNVPRVLTLVVLLGLGSPLGAQSPTPRDRAEEFARRAGEAATDGERARLWFLALAEWYEEGARAVLTLDHDRLLHAVRQEGGPLLLAHHWAARYCPTSTAVWVPSPVSYLAYAAGQWDGQGGKGGGLANQAELANALLEAAEDRRSNARELCNRGVW